MGAAFLSNTVSMSCEMRAKKWSNYAYFAWAVLPIVVYSILPYDM
jgi:hypothetical protein